MANEDGRSPARNKTLIFCSPRAGDLCRPASSDLNFDMPRGLGGRRLPDAARCTDRCRRAQLRAAALHLPHAHALPDRPEAPERRACKRVMSIAKCWSAELFVSREPQAAT